MKLFYYLFGARPFDIYWGVTKKSFQIQYIPV